MSLIKTFNQYVEERDQENGLPDGKSRNGLADPDPGELKKPHKADNKDIELAKEAVQLIMLRSAKWHRKLYKFLRNVGFNIPDVAHLVDQMKAPKNTILDLFKKKEPDTLAPNSADSSPSFYQK